MYDINHGVGIKAPIAKVYAALATAEGIAGWWSKETSGQSKVGGSLQARFCNPAGEEIGTIKFDVVALEPNKLVRWRFTEEPAEWLGSEAIFRLSQDDDYTNVRFTHQGWKEVVDFTFHCSQKWAIFMLSLKEFVETGTGHPSPQDVKIDRWN